MTKVGEEVKCAICTSTFVKRAPAHKYCDVCRRERDDKSKRLSYVIRGKSRRQQQRG